MEGTKRCQHAEAKLDPIIRAETCYFVGNQICAEIDCYLALFNCVHCQSTIAVPLPGHVDVDEWCEPTAVGVMATPPCPRREPVAERAGYVAPAEVAA